jgi:phage terminase small subunit
MAKKNAQLSLKERRFVDAFLGDARGNATEACIQAGYTENRNSARVLATRLLAKVNVGRAIAERTRAEGRAAILSADERDEILSRIAKKDSHDPKTRIRAISELNKCTGRHSVKHLHEGKLTLEEVLAESRQ